MTLRYRLWLCALMGGAPGLAALGCCVARYAGIVVSDNAQRLANVVIVGGAMVTALAILLAISIVSEAYVKRRWPSR